MNAKAMLAATFLQGKIVSNKTCFIELGLTNISREVIRMIEDEKTGFGVQISRLKREVNSRWGKSIWYYEYRLNRLIEGNKDGIIKMAKYVRDHIPQNPKTEKELKLRNDLIKIVNSVLQS